MTRKSTKADQAMDRERRATSDERRAARVWRIARFGERFEMSEYRRKGGLDWVRMFVTASSLNQSNESTQFMQQLEELGHWYPDQRDAYEGRFWRILRLTATQEDWLRGYLLGEDRRPLSEGKLAARLHLAVRAMRSTLAALKRVRLLEQVPCPAFEAPPERPPEESDPEQDSGRCERSHARGRRATSAKKGRKTGVAASIRENSETFPNSPELFKNEMAFGQSNQEPIGQLAKGKPACAGNPKPEGSTQTKTATAPTAAPPGESRSGERVNNHSHGPGPGECRSGPERPQDVTGEGLRHSSPSGERQPTTAPLRVSAGPTVLPFDRRACGNAHTLGSLVPRAHDGLTHGYVFRADSFAEEIFDRLGPPFARDSREGCRELGNYRAALMDCVDARMPPAVIEEMIAAGLKDAEEIGRHRKRHYRRCKDGSNGSPEQFWRFRWGRHFVSRLPPARAGPGEATG